MNQRFLDERASGSLLRSLLDSLPVLACYVDRQLVYRFVNAGYRDWFQLQPDEIVGRPVEEIVGPKVFRKVLPQFGRVLGGEKLTVEQWMPYALGPQRYVQITFIPHRDEFNEVQGFFALLQDMTERHATEQRLEQSEREFRSFFENSNVGSARVEVPSGRLLVVNSRLAEMTGYTQAELHDKTLADLIAPESRTDYVELAASNHCAGIDHWSHEQMLLTKSGTPLPVVVNESAIKDAAGNTSHLITAILDVSDLKLAERERFESEARFRTLADNIAQFAWMGDGTGSLYWYNRRWFEYTGTTLDEVKGWGWQRVHHPDHVERVVAKFTHHVSVGQPWEDTFPLRAKDGTYRWFLSRAVPIRDADGDVVQWFGTNTDITDRLEMEQALKESDRRKDDFLAMLGHELRNPLAAIVGGLQLLGADATNQSAQGETREVIQRQALLMNRLVDDLLDVSRIARGKIQLQCEAVDLAEVVQQAFDDHADAAVAAGIQLHCAIPDQAVPAQLDRSRIAQVVGNLLTNAIKFTPSGGTVEVALAVDEQTMSARVTVSDTGVGMDERTLGMVFEPFSQADASIDRTQGGLGLGLPIAKGLAELHGGTLTATSDGAGSGSVFALELPIASSTAPPAPRAEPEAPAARLPPSKPRSLKVVVIDDRRDSRFPVERFLAGEGHQVEVASDGNEGILAVERTHPDVVICDIGLPGIDGYEIARRIRQNTKLANLKLFALTGYGQPQDRELALQAGFDDHLVKPIDLNVLADLLSATFSGNGEP